MAALFRDGVNEVLSRDWLYRWLVIGLAVMVAVIGLSMLGTKLDDHWLRLVVRLDVVTFAAGLTFAVLAPRLKPLTFVLTACADFFCSVAQLEVMAMTGITLSYIAASANFPLMDDVFSRLDAAMGLRWDEVSVWTQQHPLFRAALWTAYRFAGLQLLVLFLVYCMRAPGEGSSELMWNFIVSLLIVIAVSVFLPAAAMPGMIGQLHIDVFLAVRNGGISVLDDSTITGLVAFPSWHTAMGVIFIYCARTMKWLLAVLAPFNVLMILATVPCGGHYLVDTLAGLVVAAISILVVRKIRRSIIGRAPNSVAVRPADRSSHA
jgi:membrane-associated phospholipid phosphatase